MKARPLAAFLAGVLVAAPAGAFAGGGGLEELAERVGILEEADQEQDAELSDLRERVTVLEVGLDLEREARNDRDLRLARCYANHHTVASRTVCYERFIRWYR